MATWTNFYVNTTHKEAAVEKLDVLTDNLDITAETSFPSEIGEYYMMNSELAPTFLAIGKTQDDWVTISHNSFDKLEDWGIELSETFS